MDGPFQNPNMFGPPPPPPQHPGAQHFYQVFDFPQAVPMMNQGFGGAPWLEAPAPQGQFIYGQPLATNEYQHCTHKEATGLVQETEEIMIAIKKGRFYMPQLARQFSTSTCVLNKQVAWFGLQAYRCLGFLNYNDRKIMEYTMAGLKKLEPELEYNELYALAVGTHATMLDLALGKSMKAIAKENSWPADLSFHDVIVRIVYFIYRLLLCLERDGIAKVTMDAIMIQAHKGVDLYQAFLNRGVPQTLAPVFHAPIWVQPAPYPIHPQQIPVPMQHFTEPAPMGYAPSPMEYAPFEQGFQPDLPPGYGPNYYPGQPDFSEYPQQ